MKQVKALVLLFLIAAITAWNWYELIANHEYYPKLAFLGPLGIMGGLVFFVSTFDKNPQKKNVLVGVIALGLMAVGLVLGIVNASIMSSYLSAFN